MRFKNFITEKYLEGALAPLYHWTDYISLKKILQFDALGVGDKWDSSKGYTSLKKGPISFTRDKNYRIRGKNSDVRITIDPIKLQQKGYKIYPFVDRWVINNHHDEQPLPRDEARWEAEERVIGPIKLKDCLVKIEMTKERYDEEQKLIKRFEDAAEEAKKTAKEVSNKNFRWSIEFWARGRNKEELKSFFEPGHFVDKAKAELAKDPMWKPKNFSAEKFIQSAKSWQKMADETKEILKQVEVMK